MSPRRIALGQRAFSLIELLVVVAILGIMMALVVPALRSTTGGLDMTRASDLVTTYAGIARQTALARNRNAELRFYSLKDSFGNDRYRALQVFLESDGGNGTWDALGRIQYLPDSVCMDSGSTLSPLIGQQSATSGTVSLPGVGTAYKYVTVTFRPDGTMSSSLANGKNNFVTIVPSNLSDNQSSPPPNHAVVLFVPETAQIRSFRP